MLDRTFQVVPGIGPVAERKIWATEVDWESVSNMRRVSGVANKAWEKLQCVLPAIREAAGSGDGGVMASLIPARLHWRAIPNLLGRVACIDVETTGLSSTTDRITVVGVYDGQTVRSFVRGENLGDFPAYIAQFPAIATFNGRFFDCPFLEQEFRAAMPPIHLDLQPLLRAAGLAGGLKAIEKQLGITRGPLAKWSGETAPWLWRNWRQSGERKYRDTLIAYNALDAAVLDVLLRHAYNTLTEQVGAPFPAINLPAVSVNASGIDLIEIEDVETPPWADPWVRRTFAGMAMRYRGECGFLDDDSEGQKK
ncbi:MAG TPA: ribonuclease H-like domain-containing protein [Candidatus Lokiarchaeia archaeon]|nr:ribonuclease H-like domain-containing protein [Candidatus Lokiarchaeia archaeon]